MSDVILKILKLMEPYVARFSEKENAKNEMMNNYETLVSFCDYIKDNSLNILSYENQDLVISLLSKINSNKTEYNAHKYILEKDDEFIKSLPQYRRAITYLEEFSKFINMYTNAIRREYNRLTEELNQYQIIKKYYEILRSDEIIITDIEEFSNIFDYFMLTDYEKNSLFISIIRNNKVAFDKVDEVLKERALNEEYEKFDIDRFMTRNDYLTEDKYVELLEMVNEIVDMELPLSDLATESNLEKINISNLILAKLVFLVKDIEISYNNTNKERLLKSFHEFLKDERLLDETKDIEDPREIIEVVRGAK